MFKWIKNKFSDSAPKEISYEEKIFQEPIIHRETRDVQNEQRHFRFPLIPDEMRRAVVSQRLDSELEIYRDNNNSLKQSKQNYQKEYSSLFLQEEAKKEKSHKLLIERDNAIFPERKEKAIKPETTQYTPPTAEQTTSFKPKPATRKLFKSTQIPSPIYGFKQRPDTEKQEEIINLKQTVEEPNIKIFEESQPKQKQENFVIETFEEIKEEPMAEVVEKVREETATEVVEEVREETTVEVIEEVREETGAEVVEELREETVAEIAEEVREETVVEVVEEVRKEVAAEVIEGAREETVAEFAETAQKSLLAEFPGAKKLEEQPKPKKRVVPFNVMMLQQDRRRMTRAKEQRENQAPQVVHKQEETSQSATAPVVEEMTTKYAYPSLSLLQMPTIAQENDDQWIDEQAQLLQETLANFNVGAQVIDVIQGPSVTRFEIQPDPGVKVNKITNLTDDIKLSLAAKDIRIEAPIPGKSAVGIEVPNRTSRAVLLSEILKTPEFHQHTSPLAVALGLDIAGNPIVTDIQKMPHGLIAGATGSGKSVCINTILLSILYKAKPHEVKVMLIDPKMVELAPYNNIPHLVAPVITDVKAATAALKWAVEEMERRYELFAHAGARDLTRYNHLVEKNGQGEKLPYLVIIIDELADLMMVAPGDVEEAICRIAQKARACGIHMILATQRPSVDVITGLIKANIPTRLAFTVSSQIDSRTIIDMNGAEKLLGRGDMLLLENGSSKPVRAQGVYVSDDEIEEVVSYVKKQMKPNFLFVQEDLVTKHGNHEVDDALFEEACEYVIEMGGASASSLQRHFRVGYNRAARLIDMMEAKGIVSEAKGSKPRDILISIEDLFSKK